jgi:hypothetical protein
MKNKGSATVTIIVAVCAFIIVGGLFYMSYRQNVSPGPALTPAPTPGTTANPTAILPDPFLRTLESHNRSEVSVSRTDIYLFAPDEKSEPANYCLSGAASGYTGNYELVSVQNGALVAKAILGSDYHFVSVQAGLRTLRDPKTGTGFIVVYQYLSCNGQSVELWSVAEDGSLHKVSFIQSNGQRSGREVTGPDGAIQISSSGNWTFCMYDNSVGANVCNAYVYTNGDFKKVAL